MQSKLSLSLCVFVCSCIGVIYGATCGTYTASDGSKYNLAPLSTKADYSGRENEFPGFQYLWNFCQNVHTVPAGCGSPGPVFQLYPDYGTCFPIGYLSARFSDHPEGPTQGVAITYVNDRNSFCSGGTVYRTTIILLTCDQNYLYNLTSIVESADKICTYFITIHTSIACPLSKF